MSNLQKLAEDFLRKLLKSWKSRYRYTITFAGQPNSRVVNFLTEWSRKPTPHEPLPDIRVTVNFSLKVLL